MNWEALGAIGELVGAVSVLLTLIYLARQIKENTKVQTISAYSSMMDGFEALHSWSGSTKELARINLNMYSEDTPELSVAEKHQLALMFHTFANHVYKIYQLHKADIVDDEEWRRVGTEMNYIFDRTEFGRSYHKMRPVFKPMWEALNALRQ
tara:strand:- start:33 stop:488 length:456 start_codon:yes stop_codon:yes gene_type:complete